MRPPACLGRIVTGDEGRFVVAGLPPGTYELRAELAGFKPLVGAPSLWRWRDSVALNIVLRSAAQETVTCRRAPRRSSTRRASELSYLVSPRRSRRCRSTAATTPTSRCCSRASSPTRIAMAARWWRTGSASASTDRTRARTSTCSTARCRTTSPTDRQEAPPAPRSAWRPSASSASRPTPTAQSSAAIAAGRSTS